MGKIIAYAILGFFVGLGIECAGKHIGTGLSQIKITIVPAESEKGETK